MTWYCCNNCIDSSWIKSNNLLFRPFENGEELCIRVFYFSFFVFHDKSGTINIHRTGLSDISK